MKVRIQTRPDLLRQALVDMSGAGHGETGTDETALRQFLPLSEHARIFEPETFLIIGHRGAGKTQLFRALQTQAGIKAIQSVAKRFDPERLARTKWVVGYTSSGTEFAAELLFQQFTKGKQPIDLQFVWLGYLMRVLIQKQLLKTSGIPDPLLQAVMESGVPIEKLFEAVRASLHAAITSLDQLDARLSQEGDFVFVTYDELDRVSSSDWEQLATIVRGLIQFWSSNARRWRRLRPKIFLRRDLYDRAAIVGPDVSKISAQRLELTWTPRDLYALLAKRFYNQAPKTVSAYLGNDLPDGENRAELGWFPTASKLDDYRPMVEHICGEFMGASAGKGRTFSWIPTHLQDGHGQVLPRSFVKLFEKAAQMEQANPKAELPRVLHHTALRGALDKVSLDRMEEFKEELPWIERVRIYLAEANLQVPIERQLLQRELGKIDWSQSTERPPQISGYDLVQFLGELGIFYMRSDNRVDVRDIYLDGLGFKRKGGVKKPF
jgi:hypothetical protein